MRTESPRRLVWQHEARMAACVAVDLDETVPGSIQYQQLRPENTPVGTILQTDQVILRNIYAHTYMHGTTISTTEEAMNLKENKEGIWAGLK